MDSSISGPSTPAKASTTPLPDRPKWSDVTTARFWNYWSTKTHAHSQYFTNQVGAGVAEFARRAGILYGNVLDYGCGPGYLIRHLLGRSVDVNAFDFSAEATAAANAIYQGEVRWRGARSSESLPTPYPPESFDLVFCVETLEHVLEPQLNETISELRRILRPKGNIIVTTPANEPLEDSSIYCPFCNSEFHEWQHQRSFTPDFMQELLQRHGLAIPFCAAIDFARFQEVPSFPMLPAMSVQNLVEWSGDRSRRLFDRLLPRPPYAGRVFTHGVRPGPHLCAIAKKA